MYLDIYKLLKLAKDDAQVIKLSVWLNSWELKKTQNPSVNEPNFYYKDKNKLCPWISIFYLRSDSAHLTMHNQLARKSQLGK